MEAVRSPSGLLAQFCALEASGSLRDSFMSPAGGSKPPQRGKIDTHTPRYCRTAQEQSLKRPIPRYCCRAKQQALKRPQRCDVDMHRLRHCCTAPRQFHTYSIHIPFHTYSIHITHVFRTYSVHIPYLFHRDSIPIPYIFFIHVPHTFHT